MMPQTAASFKPFGFNCNVVRRIKHPLAVHKHNRPQLQREPVLERKIQPAFLKRITRERQVKPPPPRFGCVKRVTHGKLKTVTWMEDRTKTRAAAESREAAIAYPGVVFWTAFDFRPSVMPSQAVAGAIRHAEHREQAMAGIVRRVRETGKLQTNRIGRRRLLIRKDQECQCDNRNQRHNEADAFDTITHSS